MQEALAHNKFRKAGWGGGDGGERFLEEEVLRSGQPGSELLLAPETRELWETLAKMS